MHNVHTPTTVLHELARVHRHHPAHAAGQSFEVQRELLETQAIADADCAPDTQCIEYRNLYAPHHTKGNP